jgi:hypothetical protein
VSERLAADGYTVAERLCIYPGYIDADWVAAPVLDVIHASLVPA